MSRYHQQFTKTPVEAENFMCERFSSNDTNQSLKKAFYCEMNSSFTCYLRNDSYLDDLENKKAVYLIKDGDRIVGYFSLNCGLMIKCDQKILSGISSEINNEKIEYYIDKDIIDVTNIVPAIEITHFCINSSYRKKKSTWTVTHGLKNYSVGKYIYYKFLLPIVINVAEKIGVQMIYLFCADDGSGKLIDYYKELGFTVMDNMACIRTGYDSSLSCMTCKVAEARKQLESFNSE